MNTKIYVANIPLQATELELKGHFGQAGEVVSVKIPMDHQTGKSRGFAFIEMSTRKQAQKAVSMLNRKSFMANELLVKIAMAPRAYRRRKW